MGFLRVAATLRRLLDESGDPEQLKDFDLDAWVAQWMREPLPELGGNPDASSSDRLGRHTRGTCLTHRRIGLAELRPDRVVAYALRHHR